MKTKHLLSAGLVSTLALITQATFAQTWQTVDDYQYVAGQDTFNAGLTVAPSGNIFGCGYGYDAFGGSHALVMGSADGGNAWSAPLDDFSPPTGAAYNAIASDSAGNLYAAGTLYDTNGEPNAWIIRSSADGGATWSTVDLLPGASRTEANSIATDSSGAVYAAGYIAGTGGTVRKGLGGTNFTTLSGFPAQSAPNAVFVHPTLGIFVVGSAIVGTNTFKSGKTTSVVANSAWVVWRSIDGGATWSRVDAFWLATGYKSSGTSWTFDGGEAFGFGADAHGNLYAVGSVNSVSGSGTFNTLVYSHWIVRKSSDGGNSWSTVDNTLIETGYFSSGATCFAADSNGNLFVAGFNVFDWVVRENPGGNGTWQTVDDFKYFGGARALATATDASGHVFVGGYGWNNSDGGAYHWQIRKH